jgi:uncharacterized protein (DUF885 family)
MVGPDCFQTLNPDGHWEAVEVFNREEAARRTIDYLISNLHIAGDAVGVLENALPALQVIDAVHSRLQSRLNDIVRVDLWRHVGRGSLNVNVMSRRMRRTRAGAEEVEDFLDERQFAEFSGYKMFSPKTTHFASRSTSCATRLGFVDFGEELQERVRTMNDEERAKAARMLSKGLSTARSIFDEANAVRSGFSAMGIANLKGWTRHQGCPVHLYISGDDTSFYIGKDEHQALRIELPPIFWRDFGDIPNISTVAGWEATT